MFLVFFAGIFAVFFNGLVAAGMVSAICPCQEYYQVIDMSIAYRLIDIRVGEQQNDRCLADPAAKSLSHEHIDH
jgi:hypothetical protein